MTFQFSYGELKFLRFKGSFFTAFVLIICLFFSIESSAKSLYEILGVSNTATLAEIKTAHRRLAHKYHPDKNPGVADAKAKFKEMQEAYDILKDPEKRQRYDQYGTTEGLYRSSSRQQWNEEDLRRHREEKDNAWADKYGPEFSNDRWTYDPVSQRMYDSRIRKWLFVKDAYFRSEEGWLFYGREGTYLSVDLRADWNPENDIGWYRQTSNFGDNIVLIDPATGFSRAAKYAPGSVSDASHLFDELMNPVSLLDFKSNRGNRSELMKQFEALRWTDSQVADFIARAKAHTTILSRPDMKINFAGDQIYFNTAMDAVLDYEMVRQNPEIVVDFLRRAKQYRQEIPKELLMKEEWLNHKNASFWLSELFRYPEGAEAYLVAALSGDRSKGRETAARFERAYSVMDKVGMDTKTMDLLLGMMGQFGDDAYNTLADKMLALTSKPTFLELIATVGPERLQNVRAFLAWYSKHEPNRARVFEQTLNMPGTKWQDFWRLSADRTQYSLAESEYNAQKARTSAARLRFMDVNLPKPNPPTISRGSGLSCAKILGGH